MRPHYGKTLKVFVESWRALNCTGVSLVLVIWIVSYTDSLGLQACIATLFELNLTIGMNGCEPGANEWPNSLKERHWGGSTSSDAKSTNFDCFNEPKRVLFPVFLLLTDLLKFIISEMGYGPDNCLVLNCLPFNRCTKHYAIWKKYPSGT